MKRMKVAALVASMLAASTLLMSYPRQHNAAPAWPCQPDLFTDSRLAHLYMAIAITATTATILYLAIRLSLGPMGTTPIGPTGAATASLAYIMGTATVAYPCKPSGEMFGESSPAITSN